MNRQPAVFLAHGLPMSALGGDDHAAALHAFGRAHQDAKAILIVSAHWQVSKPLRLSAWDRAPLVYDFGGFPEELYRVTYLASGNPALAARVAGVLRAAAVSVFVMHRHGSRNLWRIGIDGSGLRQVTTGLFDWHPALSPDGKWVAFASHVQGQRALWKASLDGANPPVKLVNSGGSDLAISPDGNSFAYRDDLGEIQIRSFADGALMRKITTPGDDSDLRWSPDGKALTFVSHADGTWQFRSVPIAGGTHVRFGAALPADVQRVNSSRDRKRIVYLRRELKVDLVPITNIR